MKSVALTLSALALGGMVVASSAAEAGYYQRGSGWGPASVGGVIGGFIAGAVSPPVYAAPPTYYYAPPAATYYAAPPPAPTYYPQPTFLPGAKLPALIPTSTGRR